MRLWRIRDRRTFLALRAVGQRGRGRSGPVTVTVVPETGGTPPRVAFAIGKRAGSAVQRNLVRRRLRAIMGELAPPSGAYLVSVAPPAAELPYATLREHVEKALSAAEVGR